MAYDSRTDRHKVTWDKKTERTRKYRASEQGTRSRQSVKSDLRKWAEF